MLALGAGALAWVLRPWLRRRALPAWLVRARARRRPGIPVTSWLGALLLMWIAWLIGEQRGIPGFVLALVWVGAPMVAGWVTWFWLRPYPPR